MRLPIGWGFAKCSRHGSRLGKIPTSSDSGSIRRECLDHVIVLNETSLRRTLKSYFAYYEGTRTHLSLGKDAPVSRPVQATKTGRIVEIPQVGGLRHRYERITA